MIADFVWEGCGLIWGWHFSHTNIQNLGLALLTRKSQLTVGTSHMQIARSAGGRGEHRIKNETRTTVITLEGARDICNKIITNSGWVVHLVIAKPHRWSHGAWCRAHLSRHASAGHHLSLNSWIWAGKFLRAVFSKNFVSAGSVGNLQFIRSFRGFLWESRNQETL